MTHSLLGMGQAPQNGQGQQQSSMITGMLVPFALMFAIIYFLMIRPQKKQQKKMQEMLSNMRKGDSVVTRGGIHGRVYAIADNIITVEIADNVRVKMGRDAILAVQPPVQQ